MYIAGTEMKEWSKGKAQACACACACARVFLCRSVGECVRSLMNGGSEGPTVAIHNCAALSLWPTEGLQGSPPGSCGM